MWKKLSQSQPETARQHGCKLTKNQINNNIWDHSKHHSDMYHLQLAPVGHMYSAQLQHCQQLLGKNLKTYIWLAEIQYKKHLITNSRFLTRPCSPIAFCHRTFLESRHLHNLNQPQEPCNLPELHPGASQDHSGNHISWRIYCGKVQDPLTRAPKDRSSLQEKLWAANMSQAPSTSGTSWQLSSQTMELAKMQAPWMVANKVKQFRKLRDLSCISFW